MKISAIKTRRLANIPLDLPFHERRTASVDLLSVETDQGLVGTAEIGHGPGAAILRFIETDLAPFLVGRDPLENERLMHEMRWRFNPRAEPGVWNPAVSSIDVALWDIKGKLYEQPVWRLLGAAQPSVPSYFTFGLRSYGRDALVEAARHWVGQGHKRLKLMVGRLNMRGEIDMRGASGAHREDDPAEDERRVRAVREAVGDEVELMVDAACLLRYDAALRWCKRLEPYNLMWFEEPLLRNDPERLAALRRHTSIPIAAGQWEDFHGLAGLVRAEAVDFLNIQVGSVGGFTMGMKAAAVAQAFDLPIGNGAYYDMNLHAAVPNGWRTEFHVNDWHMAKTLYRDPPAPEDGWVTLPETPGHGMVLDEDAVREYARS